MKENPDLLTLLKGFKPQICAFAYIAGADTPIVCHMGFAIHESQIILHTSTWMYKWKTLTEGQKISLAIGCDHLDHYAQIFGKVHKIQASDIVFPLLEKIYMENHSDAEHYKKGEEGILLICPYKIRIGNVINRQVTFQEFDFPTVEVPQSVS